ncbi:MAG: hypothetical protein M3P52_04465, partial [Actinomycetota bacterium]|nr:hypothetical protein [Actinomycetota bacterium]
MAVALGASPLHRVADAARAARRLVDGLRNHFEQNFHVRHRLAEHECARRLRAAPLRDSRARAHARAGEFEQGD